MTTPDTETPVFNEAQTLLNAGLTLARPVEVNGKALAYVLPEGAKLEVEDTDRYALHPRRKTGTVHPATVDSLIAYVEIHKDDGTTIWVHPTNGRVVAVLDDHSELPAGHGEHRADLQLQRSPEWLYWIDGDGTGLDQVKFAEQIEGGAKEVVEPSPAVLLEIASTFHAKKDVQFRQASRLQDGTVQFQFDEELTATAGKSGHLSIPQSFKLAIAPFVGEPKYAVTARLRYRLSAGKLTLSYHLDRPEDVVRDALDKVAQRLDGAFDNVYIGQPRS